MTDNQPIGIIAGAGRIPLIAARLAAKSGRRVFGVQLKETGQQSLAPLCVEAATIGIGQPAAMFDFWRRHQVTEVVLIGKVDKRLNFAEIQFDELALQMLTRLPQKADGSWFSLISDEMDRQGVKILKQTEVLAELLVPEGHLAGPAPTAEIQADVRRGFQVASTLAAFDIGQTIVLKNGTIIAVEAFEHTDATIQRAGKMARGRLVVIKVARPQQDERFDVPVIGTQTLTSMRRAGAHCLAIEAASTIMVDAGRLRAYADKHGITLLGVKRESGG